MRREYYECQQINATVATWQCDNMTNVLHWDYIHNTLIHKVALNFTKCAFTYTYSVLT